jgi:hypothetical protein
VSGPGPLGPAPQQVMAGDRVLRVNWLPGSDVLRGQCFCGASADGDDPVQMWEWLLAHPQHPDGGPAGPAPAALAPPPAHVVTDPAAIRRRAPVLI